jgi:RNA polymerase sigma-70 factor (ECF subfamily)
MYNPDKAVFSTWLFTIAKRLMIQKLREKSKFSSIESPTYDGISINDTLKTDMYDYEQDKEINDYKADIIKKLIPKLPKKYADVLVLRHFKNYSYQDIAAELDVNLNTIKSRIRQARLLVLKLTKTEFTYLDSLDNVNQINFDKIKVVDLLEN